MRDEDLIEYKKKISSLSLEDQKQRLKYLKSMLNGEIYGPMLGYSSLDRQWLAHFSDDAISSLVNYTEEDKTMYQSLKEFADSHLEQVAIDYLGNEITYKELMDNIDKVANSLIANGFKENDIVPILLPNCPETRYLIYACSKIGAIPNPIMPTISEVDLETILVNTKAKKLFLMEGLKEKFTLLLNKYEIGNENVIEISPLRSSSGLFQYIYLLKNRFKNSQFDNFIDSGLGTCSQIVVRKASDIALIEQTGGTTADTTKSVLITNGNVLASNYQLENGELNFSSGDSLLDILLPSISYGAAFEHLTLCNGIKNYMIPTLVKKDINSKISKYKPNHILMGPIHFEFVCRDKRKRKWGFIKNIVSGGDEMSISLETNSNNHLKRNNSSVPVEQGYGESECFGACACNHNDFIKHGSVGIPHLLTNMAVFRIDENKDDYTTEYETTYGEQGEICISSPVVMLGYLNNPDATDLVLKRHSDGTIWLHTGDIGYIDQEGYVFITDRIKDLIFRNGFKVSPKKITELVNKNFGAYIESCSVVGVPDDIERNVPVLFYKLKEEVAELKEEVDEKLKKLFQEQLAEIEIPKKIISLENMPRTNSGKINKKVLRKNYIDGEYENLSIQTSKRKKYMLWKKC